MYQEHIQIFTIPGYVCTYVVHVVYYHYMYVPLYTYHMVQNFGDFYVEQIVINLLGFLIC